jgi:hypothetical protein
MMNAAEEHALPLCPEEYGHCDLDCLGKACFTFIEARASQNVAMQMLVFLPGVMHLVLQRSGSVMQQLTLDVVNGELHSIHNTISATYATHGQPGLLNIFILKACDGMSLGLFLLLEYLTSPVSREVEGLSPLSSRGMKSPPQKARSLLCWDQRSAAEHLWSESPRYSGLSYRLPVEA